MTFVEFVVADTLREVRLHNLRNTMIAHLRDDPESEVAERIKQLFPKAEHVYAEEQQVPIPVHDRDQVALEIVAELKKEFGVTATQPA